MFLYIESGSIGKGIFDFKKEAGIAYLVKGSKKVKLSGNLTSVQIVSQETQTGGGVSGAAGGAVLGFLIAGPLGTAVGAGMGSKKKGINKTTYSLTFADGNYATTSNLKPNTVAKLQAEIGRVVKHSGASGTKKLTNKNKDSIIKQKDFIPAFKQVKKKKMPSDYYGNLNKVKGRKVTDKFSISEPEILKKWLETEEVDKQVLLYFVSYIRKIIYEYAKFKWLYFDRELESEKEINSIGIIAASNMCAYRSLVNLLLKKNIEIDKSLSDQKKQLMPVTQNLIKAKEGLENAGFLSKGQFKFQIKTYTKQEEDIKKTITSLKRSHTTQEKKLNELKIEIGALITELSSSPKAETNKKVAEGNKFLETDNLEEKVAEIVSKLGIKNFSNHKFNPKVKSLKKYSAEPDWKKDIFLMVFRYHFDELEEVRFKKEVERLKKEDERRLANMESKNKQTTSKTKSGAKEPAKTKKERLVELKELLDEGLISEDEFSRKKEEIISDI